MSQCHQMPDNISSIGKNRVCKSAVFKCLLQKTCGLNRRYPGKLRQRILEYFFMGTPWQNTAVLTCACNFCGCLLCSLTETQKCSLVAIRTLSCPGSRSKQGCCPHWLRIPVSLSEAGKPARMENPEPLWPLSSADITSLLQPFPECPPSTATLWYHVPFAVS